MGISPAVASRCGATYCLARYGAVQMRYRNFSKADPEFTYQLLVFIEIRGRIVKEFLRWSMENSIFFERPGGASGMGRTSGYYRQDTAHEILAWLEEQGAERTVDIPSWAVEE